MDVSSGSCGDRVDICMCVYPDDNSIGMLAQSSGNSSHCLNVCERRSKLGFWTHQTVITAQSERQGPILNMFSYGFGYTFAYLGDQSWTLDDAARRIVLDCNIVELVVTLKVNLPAESGYLVDDSSLYKVDWSLVDACTGLLKQTVRCLKVWSAR